MGKKRKRASDSLHRRGPRRDPLPRVLIVCEGEVTEPTYFGHWRTELRVLVELVIKAGGTPKTLVEKAKGLKDRAEQSSDPNDRFDHVWCVFDVDEHPMLADAKVQARDNGIDLAVSNPCFELWLLLHFKDQRASIDRHKLQGLCRKHMPGYDKNPPCELLFKKYSEAETRARALDKWHESRGTKGENPSTNVHDLVNLIHAAARR